MVSGLASNGSENKNCKVREREENTRRMNKTSDAQR
jgi:hypothetical protein